MPTYRAITPLVAFDGFTNDGDFKLVESGQLKMLDGLEYNDEDFVEHMDQPIASLVQHSTGIRLHLNESDGQISAVTHFETARELDEQQIAHLKKDYDGQMSDGIGENLLSELKSRADVKFRLEIFWLYDETKGSQLRRVT